MLPKLKVLNDDWPLVEARSKLNSGLALVPDVGAPHVLLNESDG